MPLLLPCEEEDKTSKSKDQGDRERVREDSPLGGRETGETRQGVHARTHARTHALALTRGALHGTHTAPIHTSGMCDELGGVRCRPRLYPHATPRPSESTTERSRQARHMCSGGLRASGRASVGRHCDAVCVHLSCTEEREMGAMTDERQGFLASHHDRHRLFQTANARSRSRSSSSRSRMAAATGEQRTPSLITRGLQRCKCDSMTTS